MHGYCARGLPHAFSIPGHACMHGRRTRALVLCCCLLPWLQRVRTAGDVAAIMHLPVRSGVSLCGTPCLLPRPAAPARARPHAHGGSRVARSSATSHERDRKTSPHGIFLLFPCSAALHVRSSLSLSPSSYRICMVTGCFSPVPWSCMCRKPWAAPCAGGWADRLVPVKRHAQGPGAHACHGRNHS
jgi:hypothetical protein